MFIHGESYRPPFIPQASSANQQSAVCTMTKLSWPRKGTSEQQLPPEKHAQKVSKLEAVWGENIFPLFIHAVTAFELSNNPFSIPHHNPLDVTMGLDSGYFPWITFHGTSQDMPTVLCLILQFFPLYFHPLTWKKLVAQPEAAAALCDGPGFSPRTASPL